jgi:chemotaxis protein methyltransferase CheR
MNRNLTDAELARVCEMIASLMGLHFPVGRRPMLSRNLVLAARTFGFQNMSGFIQWLSSAPLDKENIEILAAHLTISETYFWREPKVFTALTDFVLPEFINSKKKKEKSIRIWCAGCSTGEEAYSIAIALHRSIPELRDWKITILATDVNTKALSKAKTGVYGSASFRNSPPWLKSNYFKTDNNKEYVIIPEIKQMVTFLSYNLIQRNFLISVSGNHKSDIIFCRNVLMYFTKEWAVKVSQNLFSSLSEEGWLVVSSCELSANLFPKFTTVNFPGAILYRKGNAKFSSGNIHLYDSQNQQFFNTIPSSSPAIEVVELLCNTDSKNTVLKEDEHIKIKASTRQQAVLKNVLESHPRSANLNENLISIRLLANKGHLEEALLTCNEVILSYKLVPGLYLLRASILQELEKGNEAIKSLKQSIYIDPDYIMGHFTLGNLFLRQGNIKYAKRYFNNVLELLNTISGDDILAESDGLSANYIRGIILANLQTQKSE